MGMINAAAETFKAAGTELVVVYQMTWSTGGDCMVVRPGVKTPKDLEGKTIAIQLYGPHMDYAAKLLATAGVKPSDVTFRWLKELTLPEYDTKGAIVDPVSAFTASSDIDAVMCIIPDGLTLTSGGKVGTGAEGSVKGAKILLSTKTASRVIADVYAVRKDYFDANKAKVQSFVHGLMLGEEALRDLLKNKAAQKANYSKLLTRSADLLLGSPQATGDIEALLADCTYVGHSGNVAFFTGGFFTGEKTTRNLEILTNEIQTSYIGMGLMSGRVALEPANWDYKTLGKGLKYVEAMPSTVVLPPIELKHFGEEGTLFEIEIYFEPQQITFPEEDYADDYQQALEDSQTYAGAIVLIEGHADPLGIAKAIREGKSPTVIAQMRQAVKNLSQMRANAVRTSYLNFCRKAGMVVDDDQFTAVGLGVKSPKFNPPKNKQQWAANRRVVFRIKQVEAELTEFVPLD
jgi:outer membrane protein OmpA-like peptidoglycan-associated protein/ABC-type taurine transport system substrate-binding protein